MHKEHQSSAGAEGAEGRSGRGSLSSDGWVSPQVRLEEGFGASVLARGDHMWLGKDRICLTRQTVTEGTRAAILCCSAKACSQGLWPFRWLKLAEINPSVRLSGYI